MFQRFSRVGGSFAIVMVAYWAYALIAVPLIEPQAVALTTTTTTIDPTRPVRGGADRYSRILEKYFPPGSWQLATPKVLESEQAMLVVKDYKNLPDGRVELRPCTMIFFPKERGEVAKTSGSAIVLDAPGGAILEFDEPFDLKRAKIGKLVGGQLVGQITITSGMGSPDAADDLRILTRDVQLTTDRIWTPHPVDFRLGANRGSGRDMQIMLANGEDEGRKRAPGLGGIQSFQLTHDVKLHLQMQGKGLLPGDTAPRRAARAGRPDPPVEVTCQGPLYFDLPSRVATFRDHVDVLRLNDSGLSDQMTCEELAIVFGTKAAKSGQPAVKPDSDQLGGLQARLIRAYGNPVAVNAPSQGSTARCQKLEYELATGRISLEGNGDVLLHQGSNELRAPRLFYQPAESGGGLGRLLASGPGSLQGAEEKNPANKYQAQWTKECRVRPHEHNQVVSLLGGAQMRSVGMGSLAADEIHLWLLETPAGKAAPTKVPVQAVSYTKPGQGKLNLRPDRMMAGGNVEIDSPQVTGATGRLEVWFQQAAAAASAAGDGNGGNVASPRNPAGAFTSKQKASGQRFDVGGKLVRVQLTVDSANKPTDADISVDGNAHFGETKTARPGDKPLSTKGEVLHVASALSDRTHVVIEGKPAFVEARGMSLTGAKIELRRDKNRLWIDGPGRMTMPLPPEKDDLAKKPQTLEVTWQKGMDFDGRTVVYSKSVLARSDRQLLRTDTLEVSLKHKIDFINLPDDTDKSKRAELDQLVCRGGVFFENHGFDAGGQAASIDQMQCVDLAMSRTTGAIDGHGPGWLTTVRRGAAQSLLDGRGTPGQKPTDQKLADKEKDASQLSYLKVNFERTISGNLDRREVTFADQVRAIYGPVDDWDQKLEGDDPAMLGPKGVLLTCDQLTVRQMPSVQPGKRGSAELETLGHTHVEGSTYTANAHRLTYTEEKDLLVLEGEGRGDAELFRQVRPGAPAIPAAARKIMYWPRTGRVDVSDARYIDFNQLRGK